MSSLLIKNGIIATLGKENKILYNHSICIEEGYIKSILPDNKITDIYRYNDIIDARNKLIMPGLINSHMHFYGAFARGLSLKCQPTRNFTEILENLWWKLDKSLIHEDIYYSSLIQLISCIKTGTTTILDHHASPLALKGSLDMISKAYNDLGVRGILSYEISDRDGYELANLGLEENINFIEKNKNNNMLRGIIGLHAMFTLSDRTLSLISEESDRLDIGVHIHVAEDRFDKDFNISTYQLSPIQRLNKFGLTKPTSLFAHCVHIDKTDIRIIKDTNTIIVHNPQSNMNNAVGCCNIIDILNSDILLGLGTDGMTSNIFEEIQVANLIHKHVCCNNNIGWLEIEKLITTNNPSIASRLFGQKIGILEPNGVADIIILDYDPPTPLTNDNFWGHMLFGINKSKVLTTIINGKILLNNGILNISTIDETEIYKKSRELANKFWERFHSI